MQTRLGWQMFQFNSFNDLLQDFMNEYILSVGYYETNFIDHNTSDKTINRNIPCVFMRLMNARMVMATVVIFLHSVKNTYKVVSLWTQKLVLLTWRWETSVNQDSRVHSLVRWFVIIFNWWHKVKFIHSYIFYSTSQLPGWIYGQVHFCLFGKKLWMNPLQMIPLHFSYQKASKKFQKWVFL